MIDLTGYKLTFDDEFNVRSISQTGAGTTWADIRSDWRYDANSDIGFGKSSFVDPASGYDPFKVAGGALTITAVPHRTAYGFPGSRDSGLITTKGNFSQTYGYFEMRADLSHTLGAWDAFWLMPNQPASNLNNRAGHQELDVVEHYGSNEGGVYSQTHTTDARSAESLQYYSSHLGLTSGFHTYGMNWQSDTIDFYYDDQYMGSLATPSDMNGPMYLLADLAVTASTDASVGSMSMSIDYIHAYSKNPSANAVVLDTVSSPDGVETGDPHGGVALANSAVPAPSETSASIARLYLGVLDRAPDAGGLEGWTAAANQGTALKDIARAFLASDEYEAHSTDLSDGQFVDAMYHHVLGRAGESGGVQAWTDYLEHGGTRGAVADAYLDSFEFQSAYSSQSNTAYVEGLYEHVLGRTGESLGVQQWSQQLDGHVMSRSDLARAFAGSAEFQQKYVAPSDAAFVDALYMDALGRNAEAGGLEGWTSALAHGLGRADVVVGIIRCAEAQAHIAHAADQAGILSRTLPDAMASFRLRQPR